MISKLIDAVDLIAGYAFKSGDFGNYPDKVIKITQINPPIVDLKSATGINLQKYNRSKLEKYIAKKGDFVLAMTGATIGKIGRIEEGEAYINQRVLMFKPKSNVDSDFIYYVLQSYEFLQYVLNHIDSESAQPNISANTIGNFEFELPDLILQKKIGALLRNLDEKAELNRRINDNLSTYILNESKLISPAINFGKRVSRKFANLTFSDSFAPIFIKSGVTKSLYCFTSLISNSQIGSAPMFCG